MKSLAILVLLSIVASAPHPGFAGISRLVRHAMIEIGPCFEAFGATFN